MGPWWFRGEKKTERPPGGGFVSWVKGAAIFSHGEDEKMRFRC